jgi:ubiquinone/menaquinone biosynthesis C-methylase UbiE
LLRYGNARAQSQGVAVQFEQMNATALQFADESFDVVFSSMFLHELPLKDINAFMAEAFRVLKPGGLFLNMELPPNNQMEAYDSFYLDWDCYYNQEPFYKKFRDQDYEKLCTSAGFDQDKCVQFIMPQYTYMEEADFETSIGACVDIDDKVGRLTAGINWFSFGAWKQS